MKANHFNIGFAASQLIHDLKHRGSVSSSDILNFRQGIFEYVQVTVNKIFERFPVGSAMICNANVFNLTKMISEPSENLHIKARNLLRRLLNLKILILTSCDKSLSEFTDFLRDDVKKYNDKFATFNKKEHRLDEFFFSAAKVQNYKNLAFILNIVLTLSHSQAAVERGFSVNKAVLDVNMQENLLIGCKHIRDHMPSNLKPHCMEVPNPMIRTYTSARDKYESYKEEQVKLKRKESNDAQAEILDSEIKEVWQKSEQLLKMETLLDKEFVEEVKRTEIKGNMNLVVKANALKRRSEECAAEQKKLEEVLEVLEQKRRKIVK